MNANSQYDRFIDDRAGNQPVENPNNYERTGVAADIPEQDISSDSRKQQQQQQAALTNFEGCALISINLISLIWGLVCFDLSSMKSQGITGINLVFVLSMFSMIVALLLSVTITAFIYLIGLIVRNRFRASLIGCCPVFLFLVLYIEYGIILHQGLHLLFDHKERLSSGVVGFIIFQMVVGMLLYTLSCYRLLCDKRLISPHLTELEKETYEINENEIKGIRAEIQLAKQKKGIELTGALNNNQTSEYQAPPEQVRYVQ